VFSLSKSARSISGATRPATRADPLRSPGIVRVFCDIHSHMNAFILVFSHPFFAMTDAEGATASRTCRRHYSVIAWNEGTRRSRGR
jgi:hypothetical protein